MKVKVLISLLQGVDPEALAVVDGYEDGLDELTTCKMVDVSFNANATQYEGEYELVLTDTPPDVQRENAVYLFSQRRQ